MERIWPGVVVGDNTLHVHMSAVRKALGPDRGMLKTSPGRGYRLVGWTAHAAHEAPPGLPPRPQSAERLPAKFPLPTNFPLIASQLVGRSTAVQRVRDLVSAYRVVTLTGAGGIGKTVLAMKAVHGLLADFEHGTWLVELASLSDAALAPSTVAGVLDLKLGGERITAEALARGIGDRHLLLVLDNCEHLIDAVAALVEAVMRLCPRATVLATSRDVMRIPGECVYRVPALDVPALGRRRRTSSSATALWSCSLPGPRHWTRASRRGRRISRRSPRSAGTSTAFRSPSSSPLPAPPLSEPSRSPPACAIASRC
jgi:hypothetical protein